MHLPTIKKTIKIISFTFCAVVIFSFLPKTITTQQPSYTFPYKNAGLNQQQAAEHLLSRFTYGVSKTDIDQATNLGLEKWLDLQLNTTLKDDDVVTRLASYDALTLSNAEIVDKFPRGPKIKKMALDDGFVTEEKLKTIDKKELAKLYFQYRQQKGFKPEIELIRQFTNQKIIRATYSNNQLKEILTDFWFNHFNVSFTKNDCEQYIPVYERDAIRPNVVGKFENLLLATAKSPAMLLYLDNFNSTGNNEEIDALQAKREARLAKMDNSMNANGKIKKPKAKGLNENYAREVMELHTLGVDGGYTQTDVTEAARVLTGWTIYPISDYGGVGQIKKAIEKIGESNLEKRGFVHEGDFLFAMNRHDDKPKTVLGKLYNEGGYNEGVTLLKTLANHQSTANFICKKLATRFVSDVPPQSIITKMATTFIKTNGDIKQVIITMVTAPEFWTKDALREKTKSPFEYAISSLRALHANITQPMQINNWITKMGQKMYYYQAPTGYPDKAQYWINTGSLLNRMNFGLALASKRIPGVDFDLAALNQNHEPESAEDALQKYATILLPQRNLQSTLKRLTPIVNDPTIITKINEAAEKNTVANTNNQMNNTDDNMEPMTMEKVVEKIKNKRNEAVTTTFGDNSMLAQVVGVIIGSPEFQRK